MQKISVVMIVKNEMEHLERCLESVKDADEIIVCDTGSTDNGMTVNIAKRYTPNVYEDYKWEDSFAKARNHAKSKATGDWIFSIDADEYCHDFSKVREAVEEAEKRGIVAVDILQIAENDGQTNTFPRLFKNSPGIEWHGAAHNYVNAIGTFIGKNKDGYFVATGSYSKEQQMDALVKLTYGYSLTHLADPDRTLRILEKTVKDGTAGAREMYYLGREYWYRRRYQECTRMLGKYVQISVFLAEKADAFLMMARCYWAQHMAEDARDACLQSLKINSNFKEAALFMADLAGLNTGRLEWEENAKQWLRMAETANNHNVLFIRT